MSTKDKMNRREFLRRAAISTAGLAAAATGVHSVSAERRDAPYVIRSDRQDIQYIRFLTQEADPPQVKQHRKNILDFEKANPDVRVELQLTGAEQIVQRMIAALSAGVSALDVLQPNPATAFGVAAQGMLLEIDDLVESVGGDSYFYGNSVMKLNGKRYGVPFGGGTMVIWYRKDLFEQEGQKVPTTWEELEAVARHFTKKFNDKSPTEYGISLPFSKHQATDFTITPFWWANGGEYFDKDLNITFESDASVEFLDWYARMFECTAESATGWAWGDLITTFLTGQSAMTIYLGRVLSRVYSNAPNLIGKVGVMPFPKRKLLITQDDPNYLVINAKTAAPDAAKRWVKFLVTGQNANDFLCTVPGHLPPATKDQNKWWAQAVTGCKELDENPEIKKIIGDAVEYAFFPVVHSGGVLEAVKAGKDRFVPTGIANPLYLVPSVSRLTMASAVQEVVVNKKSAKDAMMVALKDMSDGVAELKKELKM